MMFFDKKVRDRESTKEVLTRLKDQEKETKPGDTTIIEGIPYLKIGLKKETPTQSNPSNIPERNVENVLKQMVALENKMKEGSSNYLNLLYDIKRLEDKFLKAVEFIKKNNIQIKESLLKEVGAREQAITRKRSR